MEYEQFCDLEEYIKKKLERNNKHNKKYEISVTSKNFFNTFKYARIDMFIFLREDKAIEISIYKKQNNHENSVMYIDIAGMNLKNKKEWTFFQKYEYQPYKDVFLYYERFIKNKYEEWIKNHKQLRLQYLCDSYLVLKESENCIIKKMRWGR